VVDGLPTLVPVVAVLGCGVAPFMIGVFTIAERTVVAARAATAMTVLASATGLGYALGSSLAGRLADRHGYTAAFAVTVSAMGLALLLVSVSQRRLREEIATTAPAPDLSGEPAREPAGETAESLRA